MTSTTKAPGGRRNSLRHRNEVVLVGELQEAPSERTLQTGEDIVTFRLAVARDPQSDGGGRDSFECTGRAPRLRRAAHAWDVGDLIEVGGALRRRFYRAGAGSRPFLVVEVDRATRRRTRE
jgi:single-strand DNA-binding protein